MPYVGLWFKAFLITLLLEAPIAAALFRAVEPRTLRRLGLVFFANLASHPAVWFVFPNLGLSYYPALLLAELWAVLVEALFYRLVFEEADGLQVLGVSALANGASFGAGLLLRAMTGWV